jgi:peptidoglycan/LPS O-acetylase OafA/YrhL
MAAGTPSEDTGSRQHLDTLDSLRGFAAIAVCLYHFTSEGMPNFRDETGHALFWWGWAGVDIFFVISGFIIPYTMVRDGYRLRDFGGFIGRRLLRVGPPSWVVAGLTLAWFFALDGWRGGVPYWSADITWPRVLHNLAYTIPFTHYGWINLVFWTLAVEFQFYLLVGLAFPWTFGGKWRFLATAVLVCAVHYLPLPTGLIFFAHAPLFLIGGAALLHREGKIGLPFYLVLLAVLGVAAALQVGGVQAAFGCATALIISFVSLRSRAGAFFGRISYSLYLVHPLVGAGTALLLMRLMPPTGSAARLLIVFAAIASSVLAAWLFNRLVEVYFIRLAKRVFGRRRAEPDRDLQPAL